MSDPPSAAEILAAVAARYASARTYQDTGEQSTVFVHGPWLWKRRTTRKVFRSAMERPHRFFFEYKDVGVGAESQWQLGAMWRDDEGVHAWSYLEPTVRSNLVFEQEVGALTGVSGGLSAFVTKLLMPELACNPVLPDAATARVLDVAAFDGYACYRIEGAPRRPSGERMVLWFDKASWLLRRLDETSKFDEHARRRTAESAREALSKLASEDPKRPMMEEFLARQTSRRVEDYTTETATIWRPRMDEAVNRESFRFVLPELEDHHWRRGSS